MSRDSKECVLRTVAREYGGRIPCDYHALPEVNAKLCRAFGVENDLKALLKYLGSDILDIRGTVDPRWIADFPQKWKLGNGDFRNYLGFTTRMVPTSFGVLEEHAKGALEDAGSVEEMEDFPYPSADWFDFSDIASRLAPYREFAIMASGPSFFQHPSFLRGIENLLCDFLINPEIASFVIGKFSQYYLEYMGRLLEAAGGLIDLVRVADDLGTQQAPLMSLEVARKFLFPHVRALCGLVHSYGAKVMMHSCGSIQPFIDDIIGCGVDVLDPIQPLARGMDFETIHARYSDRICLHGSIDTQHTLPFGAPREVEGEVRARMAVAGQKGGFIIAPAHVVQSDVPAENIYAMYETIRSVNAEREKS